MQLQLNKQKGLITEKQYAEAVQALGITPDNKKKRKSRMSKGAKDLVKALRNICKWIFDIELCRPKTPLYVQTAVGEKIDEGVFLPRANKIINHMVGHPVVAGATRNETLAAIRKIVKERRYSVIKVGSKPIYRILNEMVIYDQDGIGEAIPKPKPLPRFVFHF